MPPFFFAFQLRGAQLPQRAEQFVSQYRQKLKRDVMIGILLHEPQRTAHHAEKNRHRDDPSP